MRVRERARTFRRILQKLVTLVIFWEDSWVDAGDKGEKEMFLSVFCGPFRNY